MARECQNHAFLADHLGKADSVVANLDTEVRMAQGFCRRRSRGTYALSVLGTCGKDGRRCWNWKQWTLRAGRRQNGKAATALVVDLAKAFEKVQLGAVWKWAMYFDFHKGR